MNMDTHEYDDYKILLRTVRGYKPPAIGRTWRRRSSQFAGMQKVVVQKYSSTQEIFWSQAEQEMSRKDMAFQQKQDAAFAKAVDELLKRHPLLPCTINFKQRRLELLFDKKPIIFTAGMTEYRTVGSEKEMYNTWYVRTGSPTFTHCCAYFLSYETNDQILRTCNVAVYGSIDGKKK